VAQLYLKIVDAVQLGCYSERGLLSYFMFRVLPGCLARFLTLAQFPDHGNNPFGGMEEPQDVTLFSELDFGNQGFGKPDGAIYFRHNDRRFLIMIEVKPNQTYEESCAPTARYNSTIQGQLELKWRLMKLFTANPLYEAMGVKYVVENNAMITYYRGRDQIYAPNVDVAQLGLDRRRRLRLVEGVGLFFTQFVEGLVGREKGSGAILFGTLFAVAAAERLEASTREVGNTARGEDQEWDALWGE